jgi:hypothetical protein
MNLKINKPEALLLVRMLEQLWLDKPEWKVYHLREELLKLLDREGPSLSRGQKKRARYHRRQWAAAKGILNGAPPAT